MHRSCFVLTALLLASTISFAEESTSTVGQIVGKVVDPSGKPAADCLVTAQQNAEKMRDGLTATTDAEGNFKIENAPEGDYNLKVNTRDAKARATKSVSVIGGRTANVGTLKLKAK
jgi:5-hydroxyisourate hydrolase-like protein (transthyretin family)